MANPFGGTFSMKYGSLLRPAAMVVAAAFVVGCSADTPTSSVRVPGNALLGTFDPGGGTSPTAQAERLEVCKKFIMVTANPVPASAGFNFTSVADPAKNQGFSIATPTSGVLHCREIWLDGQNGGDVTVTEPAIANFDTYVTRVQNIGGVITTPVDSQPGNSLTGLVSGSGGANGSPTGQLFIFINVEKAPPPPPPPAGCTYTQGYWKTHSVYGPAKKADPNWANVGGPDAAFFSSGKSWIQLFNTPPAGGNTYIQLAHQYMAAKLNILAGAGTTAAVDAAITGAEAFFNSGATPSTPLTKTQKQLLGGYAGTLGSYNEGLVGPGHCGDETTS